MSDEHEEYISLDQECIWDNDPKKAPANCTSIVVPLPASIQDTLNWQKSIELAREIVKMGKKIVFELELGLFQSLKLPLDDKIQLASLVLPFREFRRQILSEFEEHIAAVIIARLVRSHAPQALFELSWSEAEREGFTLWSNRRVGQNLLPELAALSPEGRLALKLYALETHADFLKNLADQLPDALTPLILIDSESLTATFEDLLLHKRELFDPITCVTKNSAFHTHGLTWQGSYLKSVPIPAGNKLGIVIPASPLNSYQLLMPVLDLVEHKRIYAIPQESITTSWDQIDWLILASNQLDSLTMRSLQGFIAAGGQIATLDGPIPNVETTSFTEALKADFPLLD